ncbi:hypothetical protein D3C71_2073170 [compost metagenome]
MFGSALASAMNDFMSVAFTPGLMLITFGTEARFVMVVKSLVASYCRRGYTAGLMPWVEAVAMPSV